MRAIDPDDAGTLMCEGFQIYFERFGDPAAPAVLLLPTWQIVHSRHWKMQVPFLARHFQVITYDVPGNGGAERTTEQAAYEYDRIVDQGIGLLDHLGVERTAAVGFSCGCAHALWMAARYPDRISRLVLISNPVGPDWTIGVDPRFHKRRGVYRSWQKYNANYWRENYRDFLEFFFGKLFNEPHSTKPIEDCVNWALETTPEILLQTRFDPALRPAMPTEEAIERVQCPVLIVHGDEDRVTDIGCSQRLAATRPDWTFITLEGCGHGPHVRDPVKVNSLIADFLDVPAPARRSWRRAMSRSRRALFISSPIGLGHVQRDLAIARELRRLEPTLQIDWLAQHPVTRVLEEEGETIHPMSRHLSSESDHWEASAGDHELHCFYAWREMDEILLANFMVFLEAVRQTPYDLWIGDESWEVDYFLHENPECKTASYVFLTDFLGWLPIDDSSDSREAMLTADYNAQMIEHVARFPRVRDCAICVGDYDDIVPGRFGPDLPLIRDWAREHFEAVGYVLSFDPEDYTDTPALRRRLGYDPDRPLILGSVGGTAVGRPLLEKIINAWPLIRRERPEARCRIVAGPRIDPASLSTPPGLEVRSYVHNLFEHLAAADLAIVQGGLSTTMELTAVRRPFLYFPIRKHTEQVHHVSHRLQRYGAGCRLDFAGTSVEDLAAAALNTLGADTGEYRSIAPGAARRAGELIADLL